MSLSILISKKSRLSPQPIPLQSLFKARILRPSSPTKNLNSEAIRTLLRIKLLKSLHKNPIWKRKNNWNHCRWENWNSPRLQLQAIMNRIPLMWWTSQTIEVKMKWKMRAKSNALNAFASWLQAIWISIGAGSHWSKNSCWRLSSSGTLTGVRLTWLCWRSGLGSSEARCISGAGTANADSSPKPKIKTNLLPCEKNCWTGNAH